MAPIRRSDPVAPLTPGKAHTGEKGGRSRGEKVRVDPSSDPGWDDYGLPPVDVEIPDDARDLDRDVQAYHRELRTLRRRARAGRLVRPLGRRGMLIPLIAGCLALTLLSGTLLTIIAGHQVPPAPLKTSATASRSPSPGSPRNTLLPNARVTVDGKQVRLRTLVPAVLAWVPQYCGACLIVLKQLTKQAAQAHVQVYLVGTDGAVPELPALAAQVSLPASRVVNDTTNALGIAYSPMGLTAILADGDGRVGDVVKDLPDGDQRLVAELPSLASSVQRSPAGTTGPPTQPAPQAS
jgi:hypothetical protein